MRALKLYQVDAFSDLLFSGNPAAVCVLDKWLPDKILQNIASENNLSETAFLVSKEFSYEIRWFTPTIEVELCGHATLASAFVIFNFYTPASDTIHFDSKFSGKLSVQKFGDKLTLNFPADTLAKAEIPTILKDAFNHQPKECFQGNCDILLVFDNEEQISGMSPNFHELAKLDARGIIITAPGKEADFVSRFFAPQSGINEDPVTGSAHTSLAVYWSKVLNKNSFKAIQLSSRKGFIECELSGDRVLISGKAVLYLNGEIYIND